MKIVVIVQARMTSSRLPGKVLLDLAGRPMLAQQLRRIRKCSMVDEILVATTKNEADDPVVELAHREGLNYFRGSEHDVLSRFVGAARHTKADVVVRITGDCPLLDHQVTDTVIGELVNHKTECDYASNILNRTYPRGLDVEALFFDTLLRVDRLATSVYAREHVTSFIYAEQPELFRCRSVVDKENNSDLRWTVDTNLDLELVRVLYGALDLGIQWISYNEVVAYVRSHSELARMNIDM